MPDTQEMIFHKKQPLVHARSELGAGCLQLQYRVLAAFRTDQGSQKTRAGASDVSGCGRVPCILQP